MRQWSVYVVGIFCIIILWFFPQNEGKRELRQQKEEAGIKEEFLASFSRYANEVPIQVKIKDRTEEEWLLGGTEEEGEPWVSKEGVLYYPVKALESLLHASTSFYPDGKLVIERGNRVIAYEKEKVKWKEEIPYISLEKIARDLQYKISWNRATNRVTLAGQKEQALPSSYDSRKVGRVSPVRDQGRYGTCWAFGALGALESSLLPQENLQFATDHMSLHSGFYLTQEEGGEYNMSIAYLASWKGPVLEADDPYGDGYSPKYLAPVKHLEEAILLPSKDYDAIKRAVFLYGGVETNIFTSMKSASSWSQYYNEETASYYFEGNLKPNHDVIIVGWDDNYPKENFSKTPEGEGAFLCKNSWGTEFGDDGYFYVSYYDSIIGTTNAVYTKAGDVDNFDHIYQTDELGWVGQLGYGKEDAWFANVYTAKGKENLEAVSFYATMPNTTYEVYAVPKFYTEDSLQERIFMAEGSFEQAGYYTVRFEESLPLEQGQRYAVMVKIHTPNATQPIAIEYERDIRTSTFQLSDGEGYFSLYGIDWTRAETKQKANVCLKAFTTDQK
ncbi:MAG TPA: hypothetical protein IAC14_03840 [Candidatus Scybalomonas excrementigallinarum]|nr:hypothetical protein [Candidatus Scybalomonas excrementigallinarum]